MQPDEHFSAMHQCIYQSKQLREGGPCSLVSMFLALIGILLGANPPKIFDYEAACAKQTIRYIELPLDELEKRFDPQWLKDKVIPGSALIMISLVQYVQAKP